MKPVLNSTSILKELAGYSKIISTEFTIVSSKPALHIADNGMEMKSAIEAEPKTTGVKRVNAGDSVALGQTDTHTVGSIDTSKAARLTWIVAGEGSYGGVVGRDCNSALTRAVEPSVV